MLSETRVIPVIAAGAFVGLLAFAPVDPAVAGDSCSHECVEGAQCTGGCSAVASGNCAALCSGGACTYNCRLVGPNCNDEVDGQCNYSPIPPVAIPADAALTGQDGAVGWAVMKYWWDGRSELGDYDLMVVASSSPAFSDWATARTLDRVNAQVRATKRRLAERAASSTEEGARAERMVATRESPRRVRTSLHLQPLSQPCARIEYQVKSTAAASGLPAGAKVYFRARTDGTGGVTHTEPLYSTLPDHNSTLLDMVRENLWVVGADSDRPLELFGFVSVAGSEATSLEAVYGLAGARELADVVR